MRESSDTTLRCQKLISTSAWKLIDAAGMESSIPAFINGYRWIVPLLISMYLIESIIVEGLVVIRTARTRF